MASSRSLILAFIEKRPGAAARVLTAMDADDAAALIQDIPVRFATRVLTRMGAWPVCGLLTRMDIHRAAATLGGFSHQNAAALLRLMDPDDRNRLLGELPAPLQRDLKVTLSYPLDTVGANMTTAILTQRIDHTVADARDHIRRATRADAGCVIVVDEDHRLAGLLAPVTLLRSTGNTLLTEVMDTEVEPIPARALLATARDLNGWDRYASLPVVSRHKHVIGTLGRAALRPAEAAGTFPQKAAVAGLPAALADAFVGYLAGLARLNDPAPGSRNDRGNGGPGR